MTLGVLLRAKALIWKNNLLRMKPRQRFGLLAFLVLILYVAVAIWRGGVELFTVMAEMAPGAAQNMLASLFSGLIVFAFFWGAGVTLTQLYLSSDLELLLAAPLRPWSIYALKLLEGLQNLVFPALLSLVFLLAYGTAFGSSVGYYLVALLGFFCLLLLLQAAAMTLIMLVVSLIPARRAQEIYALLWTGVAGTLWAAWMLTSNRQGAPSLVERLLENQPVIAEAGRYLSFSPAGWLAQLLAAWQAKAWPGVALNLGLLLVAMVGMVALGYVVFERAFYVGWSRMQAVASRRQRAAGRRRFSLAALLGWLPPQTRAIVLKDWSTLPRDLRQLSGIFFPILMGVVYVYMATTGEGIREIPGLAVWMAMAILPLVPFFLTLYYTVGTIGLEGRGFALLRVAPLPPARLLWAKFWASFFPTLLVAELVALLVTLLLGASGAQALLFLLLTVWFCAGFCAIAVGTALVNPNFQATSSRRAIGITTTYLTLFLNALFWLASLALFAWALVTLRIGPFSAVVAQIIGLVLPTLARYLDSWLLPLALVGIQLLLWLGIAALWRRGIRWIEGWEITALDA